MPKRSTAQPISVVIPSWNGLALLRENLPSVLTACQHYSFRTGLESEVIVVDDGSADQTVTRIPEEFPDVKLLQRPENGGFSAACNSGFQAARYPIVALLNNDVRVQKEYFVYKADHFQDDRVFAVTAKVFEWARPVFATGGRFGRFRRGFWSVYFNYDVSVPNAADWIEQRKLLSTYAIGGFSTYDRDKLDALGGFLEIFSPFHWEDVDLSYRAWKRGWEVRYEPRSIGHHRASATIDSHYETGNVDEISLRNRLLFHWINLHSRDFLVRHCLGLLVLTLTRFFALDIGFYRSLSAALARLPAARELRRRERQMVKASDREVRDRLREFYRRAPIHVYYSQREVLRNHPDAGSPRTAGLDSL